MDLHHQWLEKLCHTTLERVAGTVNATCIRDLDFSLREVSSECLESTAIGVGEVVTKKQCLCKRECVKTSRAGEQDAKHRDV